MTHNEISGEIIDAGIAVHKALGPGLLESAYQHCLTFELRLRGLDVETEVPLPVTYRDQQLEVGYRLDLVVEKRVIVEIKAIERFAPIHEAQLISYLKLSGLKLGLLINFHVMQLKDGIKRLVNGL